MPMKKTKRMAVVCAIMMLGLSCMDTGAFAQSGWMAVLQESQPDIAFPASVQETMPFEPLALAPEQLIETLYAGE
jgi:hypothetical protein